MKRVQLGLFALLWRTAWFSDVVELHTVHHLPEPATNVVITLPRNGSCTSGWSSVRVEVALILGHGAALPHAGGMLLCLEVRRLLVSCAHGSGLKLYSSCS